MPRTGYTHIEVLLDRSGSMELIKEDMEGGFNSFLDKQRKETGYASIGLTQFDTIVETVYPMLPLEIAPRMVLTPRGGTALIDAMVRTIDRLGVTLRTMAEADRPDKVIFVIITDGQENSSREYRREHANARVTRQREQYGWEFVFLGANQDAIAEARSYGIPAASAMTYAASAAGTYAVMDSFSSNLSSTRNGNSTGVVFDDTDRKNAKQK